MRLNVNAKRFKEDLEWAVNSPTLMRLDQRKEAFNTVLLREINRWLHTHHPEPPQAVRDCARLGIYFEQLWKYVFEKCPLFDLVAHNLPVYKNRQTQGAFDFIYYCHNRRQHFHLEVAVKFYLSTNGDGYTNGRWDTWIGPGGEDRLDLKFNKMLSKQSELANTEHGRAVLQSMGVEAVQPELLLKGRLFYPLRAGGSPPDDGSDPPQESNPEHLRGHWLAINELDCLPKSGQWRPLSRIEWLSDSAKGEHQVFNHTQLSQEINRRFKVHPFPVMLGHTPELAESTGQFDRYFITPERWLIDVAGRIKPVY